MSATITKLLFTHRLDELPERIRLVVHDAVPGAFIVALKTSYKPTFTIPSIWLVLTSEDLLLCNTHRTRGLWRRYSRPTLPHLRVSTTSIGQPFVILGGESEEPLTLSLSEAIPREHLDRFVAEYHRVKGASQ